MFELMNKKLTKKGFTLAELLVVVAILAILVAVSIPIFSGKLHDAADSADMANVRAAKAAAVVEHLSENTTAATIYYYDAKNGVLSSATNITKGYNQCTDSSCDEKPYAAGMDKDTAMVAIKITATTDTTEPTVKFKWTNAGRATADSDWQ